MTSRFFALAALALPLVAQWPNVIAPCPAKIEVVSSLSPLTNEKFSPPKPVKVGEPKFTEEARRIRFTAGTVVLGFTIFTDGKACDIHVLSPLGLGLDESAVEALQQWRFSPAAIEGKPVAYRSTVDVNFRSLGSESSGDEKSRAQFNSALGRIRSTDPGEAAIALGTVKMLSNKKYPPAEGLLAHYYLRGEIVPREETLGFALAKRASEHHDRLGHYALGYAYENGLGTPKDESKAFEQYIKSAKLGQAAAQLRVARAYVTGKQLPVDFRNAEKFYRLCAVQSSGPCAYELSALLRVRKTASPAEMAAWALLAQDLGIPEAKALVDTFPTEILQEAQALKLAIAKAKRAN